MKQKGIGIVESIGGLGLIAALVLFLTGKRHEQKKEAAKTKQTREMKAQTNEQTEATKDSLEKIKSGGTLEERKKHFEEFEKRLR